MGRGPIGSNGACSILCRFLVTPSSTHNQIGPLWCCFLSGWACVCARPLWVSPTNSPVRLGVSPAAASTPTGVLNQWFEALFPRAGALGCEVCGWVYQLLPHCQLQLCPPHSTIHRLTGSASHCLAHPNPPTAALPQVLSTQLPISAPPTSLDECFFFISLVIRLPYSLIFCQFW